MEAANSASDLFDLKKIDITDWQSPVAAQYNVRSIPTCIVYNPGGEKVESSPDACWAIAQDPDNIKKL